MSRKVSGVAVQEEAGRVEPIPQAKRLARPVKPKAVFDPDDGDDDDEEEEEEEESNTSRLSGEGLIAP